MFVLHCRPCAACKHSISSTKHRINAAVQLNPLTITTSGPFNTWEDAGVSPIHVRPSASSHAHLLSIFTPSLSCMTRFPNHLHPRLFFNTHPCVYTAASSIRPPSARAVVILSCLDLHTATKPITIQPHFCFNPFSATVLETLTHLSNICDIYKNILFYIYIYNM